MFLWLLFFLLSLGITTYVVPSIIRALVFKPRNLKRAYNAQWAVVTGSSSGIGKALAKKLAEQEVNVVLVALQDDVFDKTFEEMQALYPKVQFRKVATDLGKRGYMDDIKKATDDIDVQIVFNNAGYIVTGFFEDRPLEAHLANIEVNSTSGVAITHHFLQRMLAKKLRGCIVFTSSAAAMMPSPFSCLYAATKAMVSSFGAGLAAEAKPYGIDVCVFHPSPVASRFYDKTHKLDMLEFFKQFAADPDDLPDAVFAAIGRTVWADLGATSLCFRLVTKLMDYNFIASAAALCGRWLPDFQRQAKARAAKSQ